MNKELVKKYKKEFDHWLNGRNIQVIYIKDDEPKWITDKECIKYEGYDNFNHILKNSLGPNDVLIVVDDEYIEFRKALAEGKSIEFYELVDEDEFDSTKDVYKWLEWKSATPSSAFTKTLKYRIKPEEPKFKVGDWVVHPEAEYPWRITQNSLDKLDNTELKLWQPKPGELVILKDKNDMISIIKYNGEMNVYPFIGEITWLHKKD